MVIADVARSSKDDIDPRPALRQAGEATYQNGVDLWTAAGHRVVAQQLADHVLHSPLCAHGAPRPDLHAAAQTPPVR